jgi:peroxiredoxin
VNSQFQEQLKQITFKTFHRNQIATFNYGDLFSARRVIVLSITNQRTTDSEAYVDSFVQAYSTLLKNGIDNMYVVDSYDMLVGPWADKRNLIGLPDRDMQFAKILAEECSYHKKLFDLARYWQYITIINNGELEKLWCNNFKSDTMLHVLKSQSFRYKKLSADVVLKYLIDNTK